MIKIAIVEDDEDLRQLITVFLRGHGFLVDGVADSLGFYKLLMQGRPDIVILDVGLPGENGLAIATQLRSASQTQTVGIIMLTSHSAVEDRIEGLKSGADIYLVKPIDLDELLAHVQCIVRRIQPQSAENTGSWYLNQRKQMLIAPAGVQIELSHLEFGFVNILSQHAGRVVKRRDIIGIAFEQDYRTYDERRLDAIVSRLRKKIKSKSPLHDPIRVAHAMGYIFIEPIQIQEL